MRNYMKSIDGARQYFQRALKKEANEGLYSSTHGYDYVFVDELLDHLKDILVSRLMVRQDVIST